MYKLPTTDNIIKYIFFRKQGYDEEMYILRLNMLVFYIKM